MKKSKKFRQIVKTIKHLQETPSMFAFSLTFNELELNDFLELCKLYSLSHQYPDPILTDFYSASGYIDNKYMFRVHFMSVFLPF